MTVDNVTFDDYSTAIWWYTDPRAVYPNYPGFADPVRSALTNSTFVNGKGFVGFYAAYGLSEVTVSNNEFLAFSDEFPVFLGVFQVTGERLLELSAGVPTSEISPALHRNATVNGNRFAGTADAGQTNRVVALAEFGAETTGGTAERITIRDNTFEDWDLEPFGVGLVIEGDRILGDTTVRNVLISDNVFSDIVSSTAPPGFQPAALATLGVDETFSSAATVTKVTITSNRFVNIDNTDGIGLIGGTHASDVRWNDFTESGIPGTSADPTGPAAIALFSLDLIFPGLGSPTRNRVLQSNNSLPAGTVLGDQVLDNGGVDNVLVGIDGAGPSTSSQQRLQGLAQRLRVVTNVLPHGR
jgi:hypothetical protein